MPTINVDVQLSLDALLGAVAQLSGPELEQFILQVIALQAQRKAPHLSPEEATLLLQINQPVPPEIQKRYEELIAKRRVETLSPDQYGELLRLTEQLEKFAAQRMACLADLARLRKISLTALMEELGIRPPAYA